MEALLFNVFQFRVSEAGNTKVLTLSQREEIEKDLEGKTWEERQAALKKRYEAEIGLWGDNDFYKLTCNYCGDIFYDMHPLIRYCSFGCFMSKKVQRRREIHSFKRWSIVCEYCNNNLFPIECMPNTAVKVIECLRV